MPSIRLWSSLAAAIALLSGWPAAAPAELQIDATSAQRGWIGLRVSGGAPGSRVAVREDGRLLGRLRLDAAGSARTHRMARWRCAPRVRTLTVDGGRAGSAIVTTRTPSCANRLAIRLRPRRPRAGERVAVRVTDRWETGRLDLCLTLVSPAGTRGCRPAQLRGEPATLRLKAPRPGRWTLDVSGSGLRVARELTIRPAGERLTILAGGDSLMAPVARRLKRALHDTHLATVYNDVHFGSGISTSFVLDWRDQAWVTSALLKPDVVVLMIGGHEGWPFGGVECCGRRWESEYATRVREITKAYLRGGAAQVYWLGVPAPADPARVEVIRAADGGLVEGVSGLAPWARRLDLSEIFTPGFVYRSAMPVNGVLTEVRMPDGLHFTPIGGVIAADVVIATLRADGILR